MSKHEKDSPGLPPSAVGVIIGLTAAALLAYAVPASWQSLSHLAAVNAVPLPRYAPGGLDGGLVGLLAVDIALTAGGYPVGWLHQVARLFAAASIAANCWAGYPDPVGMFLRSFAPFLILVLCEVIRLVLLRRLRSEHGLGDPVPFARWILAPVSTFRLWRRMKLWRITSYESAVDMEISRRQAMAQLRANYGVTWAEKVPADLLWMLESGLRMADALGQVAVLCAPPAAGDSPPKAKRTPPAKPRRGSPRPGSRANDVDTNVAALSIVMAEPGISGAELGRRLGLTPRRGQVILKELLASGPATGPLPAIRQDAQ